MEDLHLLVGLGNPEVKYSRTWHNCGFMTIEYLAQKYQIPVKTAKHKALIGKGEIAGKSVILICPQTYMNLSGEAVKAVQNFYKVPLRNVLVIYDDLDLAVGATRLRLQGGAGTHNGMKSVVQHLGCGDFPRLRIGIGPLPEHIPLINYVLMNVPEIQQKDLFAAIERCASGIESWLQGDIDLAMRRLNISKI